MEGFLDQAGEKWRKNREMTQGSTGLAQRLRADGSEKYLDTMDEFKIQLEERQEK
jgi:hypothetical protein